MRPTRRVLGWADFRPSRSIAANCAACALLSFLALPAAADEIEPEPESAVQAEPASRPTPRPAPRAATPANAASESNGLFFSPNVYAQYGDHRFGLRFDSRFRWERWQQNRDGGDNIFAFRNRISGDYVWRERLRLFAEGQYTNVFDLDSEPNGAAGLYRLNAHRSQSPLGPAHPHASSVDSFAVRQLFGEARLDAENWLRVGRQALKNASAIRYEEDNWRYLKNKRLERRLLGGVEWTHGERSYDGVSARMEENGHVLHLYAAEPTTGVFEIDRGYKRQRQVIFGGLDWTVERGTWFEDTELGAFFIGYSDDRDADKVMGFYGEIKAYTFGLSSLGVYPVGPGNLDVILWGAFQLGQYIDSIPTGAWPPAPPTPTPTRRLDQIAGAGIAEVGYQLPEVWGKPWLRVGVNFATGDSDSGDGNRNSFFNILPTNHPYYGYADQLAFSNLIDLLVQLKLSPLPELGLELAFHQFWLWTADDFRYFGSGAFAKDSLGYGRTPSFNSNNVGQEIDFKINYRVNQHVALMAGVAHLFGGGVFSRNPNSPNDGIPDFPNRDVNWAFFQVTLSY